MSTIRIGISGWRFTPWRGEFYPKGLVQRQELAYASRALPTIELNGSFYALQRPQDYTSWYADTPDDFVFSIKAPKFITHGHHLHDVDKPLANFLASGLFNLKQKLGPILWQFPPWVRFDAGAFDAFLGNLPHDTESALKVARRHEPFMADQVCLDIDQQRPLRHAVEFRHESFAVPEFVELLRRHRVALVVGDPTGKWPSFEDVTADFMYLRLHGSETLYAQGYTQTALDDWAGRMRAWAGGAQPADARLIVPGTGPALVASGDDAAVVVPRDVFAYFENTNKIKAPMNAMRLLKQMGLPSGVAPDDPMFKVRGAK